MSLDESHRTNDAELEAIFGKKPEQAEPERIQERLEVYVTTNVKDTYKCVTIPLDQARDVLPLVMAHIAANIMHYVDGNV